MNSDIGDVAFESQFPNDCPEEFWRVVAICPFKDRDIRTQSYFGTVVAAARHAENVVSGGGTVLSMTRYKKASEMSDE